MGQKLALSMLVDHHLLTNDGASAVLNKCEFINRLAAFAYISGRTWSIRNHSSTSKAVVIDSHFAVL
jgi:hypothetical protein